jgi:hypothetical protein
MAGLQIPSAPRIQGREDTTGPRVTLLGSGVGSRQRGRPGIPQGSPVSSLVAKLMIAPVLAELDGLSNDAVVVAYEDDIIVLTRTKHDAEAHLDALIAAFEQHPVGPFYPKHAEVRRVADGFDFLNYNFRTQYGRLRISPIGDKRNAFLENIQSELRAINHAPAVSTIAGKLQRLKRTRQRVGVGSRLSALEGLPRRIAFDGNSEYRAKVADLRTNSSDPSV